MNLKQLEYFVRVAEVGSFSKAAVLLDIAQPALSRQVRLLETDLRAVLLQRTGRGVVLTEAGKRLFEHAVGILQLVAQAREDLEAGRDEPTGRVVIGLPPSMGRLLTLPLVQGFERRLPKARLAIVEGLSAHITEWIATGRVDVGLVLNPQTQEAIEVQPVFEEALCLVSPAQAGQHRQGAQDGQGGQGGEQAQEVEEVEFAGLGAYPLVIPERTHAIRRVIENQAALSRIKLQVAWEVSGVQSMLDLVRSGHGHAVLTRAAVLAGGRPEAFTVRELTRPRLYSRLFLATSATKPSTPLIRHAVDLLMELARNRGHEVDHINS
jgi:LysR family nitrogen assimilation transcriptional regulator